MWLCWARAAGVCPWDTPTLPGDSKSPSGFLLGWQHLQVWLCQGLAFPAEPGWPGGTTGAAGKPQHLVSFLSIHLFSMAENRSLELQEVAIF